MPIGAAKGKTVPTDEDSSHFLRHPRRIRYCFIGPHGHRHRIRPCAELSRITALFAPRFSWTAVDQFATKTTSLCDCVAVYLASSEKLVDIDAVTFDVTDSGYTLGAPHGQFSARAEMRWRDLEALERQLAERLLGHPMRWGFAPNKPSRGGIEWEFSLGPDRGSGIRIASTEICNWAELLSVSLGLPRSAAIDL
jgi:hypothetical protein